MAVAVMCTIFYFVLILVELIPIYKDKDKKLFWVYTIMLASTFIIHQLVNLGIKVPSPAAPIKNIIALIFNLKV